MDLDISETPVRRLHIRPMKRNGMALIAALLALAGAVAAGGCSVAIPLGSFLSDDGDTTGSIDRSPNALAHALSAEDWRRARGALAIALDPQGNGAPVHWSNGETRRQGAFAPEGPAEPVPGGLCRAFTGEASVDDGDMTLRGSACRRKGAEWDIRELVRVRG